MLRFVVATAAVVASLAVAGPARANGRFPSAEQIVVQPGNPNHIVIRSTFGILPSTDGGKHFDWICEDAANYSSGGTSQDDPAIAITADGTLLAAYFGGVSTGRSPACTWTTSLAPNNLLDVSVDKSTPSTAYVIGNIGEAGALWKTTDNAMTWSEVSKLPVNFYPFTVDVAPSNPKRLYASGVLFLEPDGGTPSSQPSLARSDDGGASWTNYSVPSGPTGSPYLAGVDPNDPDTVWVRPDTIPGVLLVTRDGGVHWKTVLTLKGSMLSFAISPDGKTVLAGGPCDGIYAATVVPGDITFEKRSNVPTECLSWPDQRVFACGDQATTGFLVAESLDQGKTFSSILDTACVRGPLDCPAGSPVEKMCPIEWTATIAAQIQHDQCGKSSATGAGGGFSCPPPSSSSASSVSTSVSAGSTSSASSSGSASSNESAGSGSGGASSSSSSSPKPGGGCDCSAAPLENPFDTHTAPFALAALACWTRRRNRPQSRA